MSFVLKSLAALIVGCALGLFSAWISLFAGGGISDGPWKTNLATGSAQSDPYTRARVALHGLLALGRRETIYYTASEDSGGVMLDGKCHYEISGRDPDARWWSITAYAADEYLIPNAANRYSVSKLSVVRAPDGSFAVQAGGGSDGANWIPLAPGRISLSLRLYNPGPRVVQDPAHASMPAIKKVSCS